MVLPRLAVFLGRFGDSRLAELDAVSARCGSGPVPWVWEHTLLAANGGDRGPTLVQPLPPLRRDDEAWLATAAARSVGCRGVFEVWGEGDSVEACAHAANALPGEVLLDRVRGPWRVESVVLGSRRSQHGGDLGARMRHFGPLLDTLLTHPVALEGPAHRIWLLEDRRVLQGGLPLPQPPPRFRLLFRLESASPDIRDTVAALDLRKRAFLGSSTLPPDRALVLCNLALARPDVTTPVLLDPFCGAGGVLLAGAAVGARVVGSELDAKTLSFLQRPQAIPASADRPGRGVEAVRLVDNFDEAGLPRPQALLPLDVEASDAVSRLLAANHGQRYDAIVTDPPYGRRELQRGATTWDVSRRFAMQGAVVGGLLTRLLDLARDLLRPHGRLVFLTPVQSPRDPHKPSLTSFSAWVRAEGAARGLDVVHLGEERVHTGLWRAVVVMARRA